MNTQQAILATVSAVAALAMLIVYFKTGRPLRAALGGALPGVISLFAVNYLSFYTGVSAAINWYTLVVAGVLGLPGVITIFVFKLIWGL